MALISVNVQIEDAEEEKSSLHLKDVIKNDDGVTTIGFGSSDAATASAAVNHASLRYHNSSK